MSLRLVLALSSLLPGFAEAADLFRSQVLRASFPVAQEPVPVHLSVRDRADLAVFGEDGDEGLTVAVFEARSDGSWTETPARRRRLSEPVFAYDVGPDVTGELETIYFLTADGVVRWDVERDVLVPVATAGSLHRRRPAGELPAVDFLRDIDADDDLDLLVPDFDVWHVAYFADGRFDSPRALPIPADLDRQNERLFYAPVELYVRDFTLDGTTDLAYVQEGVLRVHPSRGGELSPEAMEIPLPVELTPRPGRGELSEVDQRDQSWIYLLEVDDFDADGLPDLLMQNVRSSGVFDKQHSLALHPGRREGDRLAFAREPGTRIDSTVVVGEPVVEDIDRDGKLDLAIGSVDFGLGALLSALVTGTIDVDIAVHRMGEDGRFEAQSGASEEISIDVDLSSGRTTIPVAELADVDGDGRKDLLIGEGADAIRVHHGVQGARPFATDASRQAATLPGNGGLVMTEDLNDDGRQDLVMRYGKLDAPGRDETVQLLIAHPLPSPPGATDAAPPPDL
jgi:hypothetical protein